MAELIPGLKEDVISGKVAGLNEAQARDIFGSDFTGVQLVDGQYRPDSSAIARLGSTGIAQPDIKANLNNNGYASSTIDQDIANLQAGKEAAKSGIRSQFERLKNLEADRTQAEQGQVNRLASISGGVGASGLGASTTKGQLLELEKTASTRRMGELTKMENEALSKLDFDTVDRVAKMRADELTRQDTLRQREFENKMSLLNYGLNVSQESRANKQLDISTINALADIPEGQSVTIGDVTYTGLKGAEAFFKGSDIAGLMKALPVGQTQTFTDPGTGETYNITGIAQPDINTQIFESEDAAGNVTYVTVDKKTGGILSQVSAGKIGKGFKATTETTTVKSTTEDRQIIDADINAIRGSDGYVDTAKYQQLKTDIAVNNPDLLDWFNKTYPAQDMLNPQDPTAVKFFQTGPQQLGGDEREI